MLQGRPPPVTLLAAHTNLRRWREAAINIPRRWWSCCVALQRVCRGSRANPGIFIFLNFLAPDWALGPVQMRWDRRDIAGRALKAGFGRVFVGKSYFSSKFGSPSATYPFFMPLIHEYLSMNASTGFVVCFSFRTRSSDLIPVSQSPPNHEFFRNG